MGRYLKVGEYKDCQRSYCSIINLDKVTAFSRFDVKHIDGRFVSGYYIIYRFYESSIFEYFETYVEREDRMKQLESIILTRENGIIY